MEDLPNESSLREDIYTALPFWFLPSQGGGMFCESLYSKVCGARSNFYIFMNGKMEKL